MRWGLHTPFQGAKEVVQPKPAGPAGWSRRGWAGPEPQRLGAQQGKVEAGRQTGGPHQAAPHPRARPPAPDEVEGAGRRLESPGRLIPATHPHTLA